MTSPKQIRLKKCEHPKDWEAYHRIREDQIFSPKAVKYNRSHPTISAKNHHHFVLYADKVIVSVAHAEFLNESEVALRSIATDGLYQNKGYGHELMLSLEKWLREQGTKVIKAHVNRNAEGFYRKLGYAEMMFDDISISEDTIDMGKRL